MAPGEKSCYSVKKPLCSNAIDMFYKQIILQRCISFEVNISVTRPLDASALSDAINKPDNMPEKFRIGYYKICQPGGL